MATTKTKERNKLVDKHYQLSMSIALQAIRIHEMQKILASQSDELLVIESQIGKLDAEQNGSGLN